MSSSAEPAASHYDGQDAEALARRLSLPHVALLDEVGSTLDVAHRIAPDAPAGTLVLADRQTAGRGRQGRRWASESGAGIWLTLVERPADAGALDVLALRCGLLAAEALDPLAEGPIGLKWPNDLLVADAKLAGILIETRWRGTAPDWVAIGMGVNVRPPRTIAGAGLRDGVARLDALDRLVPALRAAASARGALDAAELRRWRARDRAVARAVAQPSAGVAAGISAAGELLVRGATGEITRHRSGSLVFASPSPPSCS